MVKNNNNISKNIMVEKKEQSYDEYTVNIKGKDYRTVDGRIKEFWDTVTAVNGHGSIKTDLLSDNETEVSVRAEVTIKSEAGDTIMYGTGHAHEIKSSSFINKTSALENCETSAVGRALGMLAIGLIAGQSGIASADEVHNAVTHQGSVAGTLDDVEQVECETCSSTFTRGKKDTYKKVCISCYKKNPPKGRVPTIDLDKEDSIINDVDSDAPPF